MLAAARRPEAVRSLILVEAGGETFVSVNDPVIKADTARKAEAFLRARTPAEFALEVAHSLEPTAASGGAATVLASDPTQATSSGCAGLRMRQAPADLVRRAAETVARAHIPVLVITGGWNPAVDKSGEALAEATGGRHIVIPSPNHYVQLSSPEAFNRAVDAFMRDADAKRSSPRRSG